MFWSTRLSEKYFGLIFEVWQVLFCILVSRAFIFILLLQWRQNNDKHCKHRPRTINNVLFRNRTYSTRVCPIEALSYPPITFISCRREFHHPTSLCPHDVSVTIQRGYIHPAAQHRQQMYMVIVLTPIASVIARSSTSSNTLNSSTYSY